MPAPSARRDGTATRQKLLRAALELYTTTGFLGTTTPDIALRAGVAEGTIYRHFSGKEDLLNEVYRAAHRWALDVITESDADRVAPAPDRLQQIARRLLEAAERDQAASRMVLHFSEDRHLDETSRGVAREVQEALQQVIAAGQSDSLIRAGPADLWARVWLAVVAVAAEGVRTNGWAPDHPQAAQALQAAWDAIKA